MRRIKSFIDLGNGTFKVQNVRYSEEGKCYTYTIEVDPINIGIKNSKAKILYLHYIGPLNVPYHQIRTVAFIMPNNHFVDVVRNGEHKVLVKVSEKNTIYSYKGRVADDEKMLFKNENFCWHKIVELAEKLEKENYVYELI